MSDRFQPISMEQLSEWIFTELEVRDSIFGIPREHFFVPSASDRFRTHLYGQELETPFGPAAGPHSQMAQNIIVAWLCGSRFMELKTVQTIDELDISKPCIDMEDEGYNVEWSQELKVYQSFDEYLRAWILIHALHHILNFDGPTPGMIFNMSVGYNLEGIQKPNVQWFLAQMRDCSAYKQAYVGIVARHCPAVRDIDIPDRISDSVTLSTMHGCPPDEIERICAYLMTEWSVHTSVKCNPTLIGPERCRKILHQELRFSDVPVPDAAFEHDLKYHDAVPMLHNLRRLARERGLTFGVKLTNTLEVENFREVFHRKENMMYLSGRPLHALTVNLAHTLAEEFRGDLLMSFSAGADCFTIPSLLRAGLKTVTVCSDLLKSGGYMRMLQYFDTVNDAMDKVGALDLPDFACKSALKQPTFTDFAPLLCYSALTGTGLALDRPACEKLGEWLQTGTAKEPMTDRASAWALRHGLTDAQTSPLTDQVIKVCGRINLRRYADQTRQDRLLKKGTFITSRSKTARTLKLFDCIEAPCVDECPVDQKVPQYMAAVREGDYARAVDLTREDNPIPSILGRVCDHTCENTCIRVHYDEPLAIRDMKRFIMSKEGAVNTRPRAASNGIRAVVIGAGPAGMSAASELAYAGFDVTVYEMHAYAGGMVGGTIPIYRLPQEQIEQDLRLLERLGVTIHYNSQAGKDVFLSQLRKQGVAYVVIAVGAQLGKRLGLDGEDSDGVMDALYFLRNAREGTPVPVGERVGVIGAGDTAMDCARSAWRLSNCRVSLIYRRTIDQMPADREEVRCLLEEGIEVVELAKPHRLHIEDGRLQGLVCTRMEYRGDHDAGGRKTPHEIPESEFEIPLDTMILAISQHAILDFFGEESIRVNRKGYIEVDPATFETSAPGVYAGGDAVNDGPSSIVKAAADGKAIVRSIARQHTKIEGGASAPEPMTDFRDLLKRRATRAWRVPVAHTSPTDRRNFNEVVQTYSDAEAKREAERCLDCHTYCSICVGVCPNLALMTYTVRPISVELPVFKLANGEVREVGTETFRVNQGPQIAVLTDFCNECGDCVTFCPTAGEPYRDKPRLYLNREEFEAQSENAFMLFRDGDAWCMDARMGGATHRIEWNVELTYRTETIEAILDPDTLDVRGVRPTHSDGHKEKVSLAPCASMFVLLKGIRDSMPYLPTMPMNGTSQNGVIRHPGYKE